MADYLAGPTWGEYKSFGIWDIELMEADLFIVNVLNYVECKTNGHY